MPRELHDREDLLRDARALTPRLMVEVRLAERHEKVFAGFRGESLSLYFGDEPVFHFNSRGELRRAHVGGRLISADGGMLCELRRVSHGNALSFAGEQFDKSHQQSFVDELACRLVELRAAFDSKQFRLIGLEPPDADALGRLLRWLTTHTEIKVAASARVD